MNIETLEDWNARLACCCGMPACPAPRFHHQWGPFSIRFVGFQQILPGFPSPPSGQVSEGWRGSLTKVDSRSYEANPDPAGKHSGEGYYTKTEFSEDFAGKFTRLTSFRGVPCAEPIPTYTFEFDATGSGGTTLYSFSNNRHTSWVTAEDGKSITHTVRDTNIVTGDVAWEQITVLTQWPPTPSWGLAENVVTTWPEAIDIEAWEAIARPEAAAFDPSAKNECYGDPVNGTLGSYENTYGGISSMSSTGTATLSGDGTRPRVPFVVSRFKLAPPLDFEGNYYKVTYDTVFIPIDSSVDPSFVEQDLVSELVRGEGQTWQDAIDASPWLWAAAPSTPGSIRIRNVRYSCWQTSRYGDAKPQVTGEAFSPPAP